MSVNLMSLLGLQPTVEWIVRVIRDWDRLARQSEAETRKAEEEVKTMELANIEKALELARKYGIPVVELDGGTGRRALHRLERHVRNGRILSAGVTAPDRDQPDA